jgi:hypothetical protein
MSAERPFYGLANFAEGEVVQIADGDALAAFLQSWKFHHPLESRQLAYGGREARVRSVSMYHGGDILYELDGIPGIRH